MPTPWLKRIQEGGQLTVFNKGGTWAHSVGKALATFNSLGFPVKLVSEKEEKKANIVAKVSQGPDSYDYDGNTAKTPSGFTADGLHGATSTLTEVNDRKKTFEIIFAAIFLPGKHWLLMDSGKQSLSTNLYTPAALTVECQTEAKTKSRTMTLRGSCTTSWSLPVTGCWRVQDRRV